MAGHGIDALYGGITNGGIGVNHGRITQYFVEPGATPEERMETAWRCLRAGLRERAEQLLDEAVAQGHDSARLRYLRILAAVSHRATEELTDADWVRVREILAPPPAPGTDPEGFDTAVRAVHRLLTAAVSPQGGTAGSANGAAPEPVEPTAGTEAAALLAGLPDERRAEVEDHLRHVVRGIERDANDAEEEAAVHDRRFAHDRTRRVPLFFTADPLPPQPPEHNGDSGWLPNVASGWGLAASAFVGGLVLALVRLGEDGADSPDSPAPGNNWPTGSGTVQGSGFGDPGVSDAAAASPDTTGMIVLSVLLALGVVTATVAAARPMMRKRARTVRMRKWRAEPVAADGGTRAAEGFARLRLRRDTAARTRSPAGERPTADARRRDRFRQTVTDLVQARFTEHTPDDRSDRATDWMRDSAEQRRELVAELTYCFWRSGTPAGLDWLIQRRAADEAARWRAHGPAREPRWAPVVMQLGVGLLVLLLLLVVIPMAVVGHGQYALLTATLWTTAGFAVWEAVWKAVLAERLDERRKTYDEDRVVHAEWSRYLADHRPDDVQLADWLDLDQRHLLREVLREHEMEHRDIVFSFFVLEAAPDCVRARVMGGPVRYSSYLVKLFVLTTSGVWTSTWLMDFTTGDHTGRSDVVFRYDAISSAMLKTLGRTKGREDDAAASMDPDIAELEEMVKEYGPPGNDDRQDSPLPSEALRLVLDNRQFLDVFLEDYALLDSTTETPGELRELARETSGVSAGFRILAALATEGREWFDQRRRHSCAVFLGEPATTGTEPRARLPR
ncbi:MULTISPECIES: hypothetical protein [Streptomyces]|uniref:Uncharacterized protein n=2 Tax=Streptomyces TaxID=1883 RepID=A0A3M8F5I1_9ACTN|nr:MULTISPECIES: hypothetical protein [Streptomyces]KNE80182.1 hypothetical protein ADZ36_23525 [Streptomyces fradiae]OFA40083.1 hypothetical protein BEN35_26240 [Streptomyces fradiae]PQM21623.1 hypothetical protein Sfr7A_21480 [Streptomyces xinghaiensis]RKM94314.1 hypothetical protein SFRA_017595 [Streptomyces xinghaiensis]RNC71914.1 hypothetical protein DC095_019795 [Streptomyces xinghaiensis]